MGLFDIFRRHKKKAKPASEASTPESAATSQTEQPTTPTQSTTPAESAVSAAPTTPASQSESGATESAASEAPQTSTVAEKSTSAQPSTALQASEPTQPMPVAQPSEETQPTVATPSTAQTQPTAVTQPTEAAQTTTTQPSQPAERAQATVTDEVASESATLTSEATTVTSESTAPASEPASASEVASEENGEVASASSASAAAETTADESGVADVEETTSTATSEEPASGSTAADEAETTAEASGEADTAADQTVKKYDRGLAKSRTGFGARLNRFLANFRHVDEDFFDDLEDMLIESDVGYDMAMKLSDELREEVKLENAKSKQDVSNVIIEKMVDLYDAAGKDENPDLNMAKEGPTVIMFVGVNGAGKTTTIGKMAALFKKQGKKVLLAAADTFRAGATEQLDVWAKRDGVDIVTGPENGDPAAVVFDAVRKAKQEDYDILFVDTAGRLQNKVNLMKELAKMKRILTREIPDAPHEVLLVLDATTGQNALNQAKLFKQSTDVTGIVLTKLDGTARGGIVLAIRNELHLPVKYVGLGEQVDDLQKFDASDFVYGLFKGLVDVD